MEMSIDNCGNIIENPNANEIALYNELLALRNRYDILQSTYNHRLKADMVAMLTEIQLEIEEVKTQSGFDEAWDGAVKQCSEIIQQKIDKLKEETEVKDDKS